MKLAGSFIVLSLAFSLLFSCNSGKKKKQNYSPQEVQEALLAYNKRLSDNIRLEIANFIKSSPDTFVRADKGFYYRVIKKGNGVYPSINNPVACTLNYRLLDGTICYPDKEGEIKEFIVGRNSISILNHALPMVDVGGEIQVIVSPVMGFGMNGDGNKIPPARPFLVNISLLKVNNDAMNEQ